MRLLNGKLRKFLPRLYGQEERGDETIAYVKLFTPDANWSWYVAEFDGEDTCYGLVDGLEKEIGYFSISEIEKVRGRLGLPVERDLFFHPTPLKELRK